MNLTYIILAHNDPKHLARLISALSAENVNFVIHIDIRAQLSDFTIHLNELDMQRITFIKKRCISDWGSFEIIQATLNSLRFVYNKLPSTDRVILMSGHDYPIKSNRYIFSYLKANPLAIYLNYNKIPYNKWNIGGKARFPYYEKINEIMPIYTGSQWFSIPNYALKIIFDFLKLNPNFIQYYRTVAIPDESFFQTLFLNCGEKIIEDNLVNRNLHLIKWDYPYLHPRELQDKHFKLLKRTRFLFARKFSAQIPSQILDRIDIELLSHRKNYDFPLDEIPIRDVKETVAVLFLTNKNDKITLQAYNDMKREAPESHDVFLLYHQARKKISKSIAFHNPLLFDNAVLTSIGFKGINNKLVPGSNHFPLFQFYDSNPNYTYYWYVEDDVRFNGPWGIFFESFSKNNIDADFLSCHIRRYQEEPNWHWWESLKHSSGERIPLNSRIRSFNPIFRISNRAIAYLKAAYRSGWSGHHEVSIASLLIAAGFSVYDLGSEGDFILPKPSRKYYQSALPDINGDLKNGSVRFRPFVGPNEMQEELLYHPIKVFNKKN